MAGKRNIPAYVKIERHLRQLIAAGRGRDEPLPSEAELTAKFKVSRMTVRQAYTQLVTSGVVVRRPHVGTFVNERLLEDLPITGILDRWPSVGVLRLRGGTPRTYVRRVVEYKLVRSDAALAEAFRIEPGAPLTFLRRLRIADGVRIVDTRWMPAGVRKTISKAAIERASLTQLLLEHGITYEAARIEIDAHPATKAEAAELAITIRRPVLERRVYYSEKSGKLVLCGTSLYPAESFTYRVWLH